MAHDMLPANTRTVASPPTSAVGTATKPEGARASGLANNFQTFLSLLTTQLKNQNPLDPINVNQFTQQLVQFAQVEQQLKGNTLLTKIADAQKTMQSTQALAFVGRTAVVDGSAAALKGGSAFWAMHTPKHVDAVISITNSAGQTVHSESRSLTPGANKFVWDGRDVDGRKLPEGIYTLAVASKDGGAERVPISTEVQGTVDSADLTASPVLLSIGGQSYTIDKIRRVAR